ncbi:MAG: four helix bundle protein [Chloroflexi bacterium]|nr:four helix bundle protein [Chloroflexota bacterium]
MSFKFEQLDVWQLSLEYSDLIYELADKLPDSERFNLKSQITRAATSVSLNIAEGSTGQSDPEQSRFLGMAIRSLIETVACQRLIARRKYLNEKIFLDKLDLKAQELAKRLHVFRRILAKPNKTAAEEQAPYDTDEI